MLCPACDGTGWRCEGWLDLSAGRKDGDIIPCVAMTDWRRCPLRCERGYYVTALMIGARAIELRE